MKAFLVYIKRHMILTVTVIVSLLLIATAAVAGTSYLDHRSSRAIPQHAYQPLSSEITIDGSGLKIVRDEVIVTLTAAVATPSVRITEIAHDTDGQVVGSVPVIGSTSYVRVYELRFPRVSNLNELQLKRSMIQSIADVEHASLSYIAEPQ